MLGETIRTHEKSYSPNHLQDSTSSSGSDTITREKWEDVDTPKVDTTNPYSLLSEDDQQQSLVEVAMELEKQMTNETSNLKDSLKADIHKSETNYRELIRELIKEELPRSQTGLTTTLKKDTETMFTNLQQKADKLASKIDDTSSMIDQQITYIKGMSESFRERVTKCNNKLQEYETSITKKLENLEDSISRKAEDMAEEITDDINEHMEFAEKEIQASAISFTQYLEKTKAEITRKIAVMDIGTTWKDAMQNLERFKLRCKNAHENMDKWNLQQMGQVREKLDVHLVASVAEIERATNEAVKHIKTNIPTNTKDRNTDPCHTPHQHGQFDDHQQDQSYESPQPREQRSGLLHKTQTSCHQGRDYT